MKFSPDLPISYPSRHMVYPRSVPHLQRRQFPEGLWWGLRELGERAKKGGHPIEILSREKLNFFILYHFNSIAC